MINDRDGHEAGDGLLLAAAESLQAVVRREDVLARVGGDEFAVLVSDCDAGAWTGSSAGCGPVLDAVGVRGVRRSGLRAPGTSLLEAWQIADLQMYAEKHGFATASWTSTSPTGRSAPVDRPTSGDHHPAACGRVRLRRAGGGPAARRGG